MRDEASLLSRLTEEICNTTAFLALRCLGWRNCWKWKEKERSSRDEWVEGFLSLA